MDRELYMELPPGRARLASAEQYVMDTSTLARGTVCRLVRGLYGAKQSPALWNKALDTYLRHTSVARFVRWALGAQALRYVGAATAWFEFLVAPLALAAPTSGLALATASANRLLRRARTRTARPRARRGEPVGQLRAGEEGPQAGYEGRVEDAGHAPEGGPEDDIGGGALSDLSGARRGRRKDAYQCVQSPVATDQ